MFKLHNYKLLDTSLHEFKIKYSQFVIESHTPSTIDIFAYTVQEQQRNNIRTWQCEHLSSALLHKLLVHLIINQDV